MVPAGAAVVCLARGRRGKNGGGGRGGMGGGDFGLQSIKQVLPLCAGLLIYMIAETELLQGSQPTISTALLLLFFALMLSLAGVYVHCNNTLTLWCVYLGRAALLLASAGAAAAAVSALPEHGAVVAPALTLVYVGLLMFLTRRAGLWGRRPQLLGETGTMAAPAVATARGQKGGGGGGCGVLQLNKQVLLLCGGLLINMIAVPHQGPQPTPVNTPLVLLFFALMLSLVGLYVHFNPLSAGWSLYLGAAALLAFFAGATAEAMSALWGRGAVVVLT